MDAAASVYYIKKKHLYMLQRERVLSFSCRTYSYVDHCERGGKNEDDNADKKVKRNIC